MSGETFAAREGGLYGYDNVAYRGDTWRPNTPADIEVVPEDLSDFATKIEEDRNLFVWDRAVGIDPAFDQQEVPFPSFKGHEIDEQIFQVGLNFQLDYGLAWHSLQMFLNEVQMGLMMLGQGAANIHMAYLGADALEGGATGLTFDTYQDVNVVQDTFSSPTPAPLERDDAEEFDLDAMEGDAASEFEQLQEDQEGMEEVDDDEISGMGDGDLEPRDQETVQPAELDLPQDNEGMDEFEPRDHPAPSLAELD